jgi:hypothetical protein
MNPNILEPSEIIVTFTGGLGAQIFSAAIYFHLKNKGQTVYADLEYFKQPSKTATVGNKGEISHWKYELGEYEIPMEAFATKKYKKTFFKRNMPLVIADGVSKVEMAIDALQQSDIKKIFPINPFMVEACCKIVDEKDYLCIHIRRGDYVNVASHLVSDMDFIQLSKSISASVSTVVVISDSEPSDVVKENLTRLFAQCSYCIGGDPHIAHVIIRQAKFLICSNSQFSLSAALLNDIGRQIFLPTKWFGDADSNIQVPINKLCSFQILSIN